MKRRWPTVLGGVVVVALSIAAGVVAFPRAVRRWHRSGALAHVHGGEPNPLDLQYLAEAGDADAVLALAHAFESSEGLKRMRENQ